MGQPKPPNANLAAAGAVFEKYAKRQELSLERWAKRFNIHPNTFRAICKGTYNSNAGPTLWMFDNICSCLAEGDLKVKQAIAAEFLSAAGVLPRRPDISIAGELARIDFQIRRIARDAKRLTKPE